MIKRWLAAVFATICHAQSPVPLICSDNGTVAPPQRNLTRVSTTVTTLPRALAYPWGLVYATAQDDTAFVGLTYFGPRNNVYNATLGVLNTSTSAPRLTHEIALPPSYALPYGPGSIALSHDGSFLVVSAGYGGVVVNTALAVSGASNAIVGLLNGTTTRQNPGTDSLGITLSSDDDYAFFNQEFEINRDSPYGNIDVIKIKKAGNSSASFTGQAVGYLNLSIGVIGSVLSSDGNTLYAVSEQAAPNISHGSLAVMDVNTLKTHPSKALLSSVVVGCGLVRAIISSDSKTLWVTSREDNTLLAFDTAKLVSSPKDALLANVTVGTSPVSLIFVNENRILTANSNRFQLPNATTGISVVDVQAALSGRTNESVLGQISTGLFPRQLALSPDGCTVLVSDYSSHQIQTIDVASLP